MKTLKFTKEEFKGIFNNKMKFIAFIAVIIIPLLYSFFYLKAYWDPYNNLKDYSIAVVNEDKGATLEGEKHNYGNEIVDNLKDKKDIGFKFVSADEARDGLKNDRYFSAVFISKDFSEKIVNAKQGKAVPPVIEYVSNDKKNYIGSKISKAVQNEMKEEVTKNISEEYGKAAFESIYDMRDGMKDAADGSKELLDGQGKLKDGTNQLNNGLSKMDENMPKLADGFGQLYDGMAKMEDGINNPTGLKNGALKLSDGLKSAGSGSAQLNDGLNQASSGVSGLYDGISQLNTALNTDAKDGNNKPLGLKNGAMALEAGVEELNTAVNTNAKDENGNPLGLKNGMNALNKGVNTLNKGINGENGLVNGVSAVDAGTKKLATSVDSLDKAFQAYKENPSSENLAQVEYIIGALKHTTSDNSNDSSNPTFKDGIDELKKGVYGLGQNVENSLVPATTSINKGVNTLATSLDSQLVPATKGVSNGVQQVSAAIATQVEPGTAKLQEGLQDLNQGSQDLNNGVGQLYNGSVDMVSGVNTLSSGASTIKDGMGQFNENIPVLSEGIEKLLNGSKEIAEGMDKAQSGTEELEKGLKDGVAEVNDKVSTPSKELGKFVGEPVKVNETSLNPVPNYGTGLAPYFLPISSWLGAVFIFFVLKSKRNEQEEYNTVQRVLGSYFAYAVLGIIQAVALSFVVLALGIKPSSIPMMFIINICMSLCFVSIIQCFTSLLGLGGEGLAIIVLVLQLCSDAGTFPLETLPKAFKAISKFFPFTYCVEMIREAISATSVNYSLITRNIGMLAIFTVIFMVVNMIFNKKGQVISETLEEKLAA